MMYAHFIHNYPAVIIPAVIIHNETAEITNSLPLLPFHQKTNTTPPALSARKCFLFSYIPH